jgi:GT2 family glycosyltransferase
VSGYGSLDSARSVAVVIPSWNSARLLPPCLVSLAHQGVPLELLVVDNGSTDGTVALLRERGVEHIALPRNIGFAAAVNLGASRVGSASILVLNADTVLEPGSVGALAAALEEEPGLGGVQPRILRLEEGRSREVESARVYSAGMALSADGRAFELETGEPQGALSATPREIFAPCGAACLLRRELFDRVGGYDERYFAFYEDVELGVRARIGGWRFAYVPEAVVWHHGNVSWIAGFARPSAENARLVARNRVATQLKFMPAKALPRILAVELGSLLRAARQRRFGATLRGKVEGLRWLPALLRERRALARAGDPALARRWLGVMK